MNQILSTEALSKPKTKKSKEKVRSNEPLDIQAILKFFAIVMIVFGVCITGTASFGLYRNIAQGSLQSTAAPEVSISKYDEVSIAIIVTHSEPIKNITYQWNDDQETVIEGENRTYIEEIIPLPSGTNTIKVVANDVNGKSTPVEKEYQVDNAPIINLEVEGNNIKAIVTSNEGIAYMTYRWDEGEETRIEVSNNQIEKLIEIPKGLHTLTIVAVDVANKTSTKTQEVNGVTKPKLEVTTDGQSFIINASDEQGLSKAEFILNGQGYRVRIDNQKEFTYSYPLQPGENKLEVKIYNVNGITETFKAKCTV